MPLKILKAVVNAPWYITNERIHNDLKKITVMEVLHKKGVSHYKNLENPYLKYKTEIDSTSINLI